LFNQRNTSRIERPRRVLPSRAELSECSRDYVKVLENPFSGAVACVPTQFNVPSLKQSFRARGVFHTGTNGVGSISFAPRSMLYFDTNTLAPAAAVSSILYTTSEYNGVGMASYTSDGVVGASGNSPYSSTTGPENVRGRLVAAGLRVRNITNVMSRGGQVIGLEAPAHDQVDGQGFTNFYNFDQAAPGSTDGQWTSITYHPIDGDEYDFFFNSGTNANPFSFAGRYMGFLVSAPSPDVFQNYEFEAYTVFEVVGRIVHGMSPSMSDPNGMAVIQNAYSQAISRKPFVGDRVLRVAQAIGQIGMQIVKGAITGMIPNPMAATRLQRDTPMIEAID